MRGENMIQCYTGVPGSGKSYHVAKEVYNALRSGMNVISNLQINTSIIPPKSDKKPLGKFIYIPNDEWMSTSIYEKTTMGYKTPSSI